MTAATRRRILLGAPLVAAGAGMVVASRMLTGLGSGRFDPHDVGTPGIGRAVPAFDLPSQPSGRGFSSVDLHHLPGPVLVNFCASWCVPCVAELPALQKLASRLPLWGVAYKDDVHEAAAFFARAGVPYARIGADRTGLVAIDWGVTGVPESFLVDHAGIIRGHWVGGLTDATIAGTLLPLIGAP